MKKMICLLLILVLALGLCACSSTDDPKYLYGNWEGTYVDEDENETPASMTINADKTVELTIGEDVYTMTWTPVPENADALYMTNTTLNGVAYELVEVKNDSTQLKAAMTVVEGEFYITITDINFKDDVNLTLTLKRVS